jgi:homospermidine synthase
LFDETEDESNTIRKINRDFGGKSATAVISHGANPGLVNHFIKVGIEEIASTLISEKPADARVAEIRELLSKHDFGRLAHILGIKLIQISENDTQRVPYSRERGVFLSSWSVDSFCEEIAAPAEFAWGTHETQVPEGAMFYHEEEHGNALITLKERGHQVRMKSWIPPSSTPDPLNTGDFEGLLIRHEECVTMAKYLEVQENGSVLYRPTLYFVYNQNVSKESIAEFVSEDNNYDLLPQSKIVSNDVVAGADYLGVFLLET